MKVRGYYYIFTYGCQMNVHESEKLAGVLNSKGYTATEKPEDADIIVFNTCCIRESAEQKILGNIGAIKPIKKNKKDLIVAVCGCMSQQSNMAGYLKQKFPFIDIIFGANNVEYFGEYLDRFLEQRKFQNMVIADKDYIENKNAISMARDSKLHAFVNIIYGCNNFCTYCIVPFVRGREHSRAPADIIKEVQTLVNMGYKVITLLGQNVNSYGKDLTEDINFAKLLEQITALDGDFEIRFMSSHPKDLSDDVIDVIANQPKISRAIHLPVQSGSNSVLKAMNRNYTRENYLDLVSKIKSKIPNVKLSTDIIVGFPGETDKDYQDTVDLIEKVQYSNAFIFMYSKRKGTIAEKMENQIAIDVKRKRIHDLLNIQHEISDKIFRNLINKQERVLVEDENKDSFIAKLQCGKIILIDKKSNDLKVGSFAEVKLIDYVKGDLIGKTI